MEKVRSVSQDLHSRVPDSTVERAATRAALQSLLDYHDSYGLEVEREQSILALLRQHTRSLRGEEDEAMEENAANGLEETPCLQQIRSMQEQYDGWATVGCGCSSKPDPHDFVTLKMSIALTSSKMSNVFP